MERDRADSQSRPVWQVDALIRTGGCPLASYEVVAPIIAASSRSGLAADAELGTGICPDSVKISGRQMSALEKRALRRTSSTANGTIASSMRQPEPAGHYRADCERCCAPEAIT